jgi:hypothetical protein
MARVGFWRLRTGNDCGARVRLQVLDLHTGEVIDQVTEFPEDGRGVLLDTPVGGDTNPESTGTMRLIGARVAISPADLTKIRVPACKRTFPFRLTLQSTNLTGRATSFYEGWPCKWFKNVEGIE